MAIIDNLVVSPAAQFFLWPLPLHPLEGFLTGNAVTLHDALDAYLLGGSDDNDAVDKTVDTRLVEDGALHPLVAALLKVPEDGWMHNGVNLLGISLAFQQETCDVGLFKRTDKL